MLTCLELCVIVCASNQLKCLLKSHRMLGRTVQRLDTANKGGHFPFCLTGGWRQERLIALVERARPDGVCHSQHRDLEERKGNLVILTSEGFFIFLKSPKTETARRTVPESLKINAWRHNASKFEKD